MKTILKNKVILAVLSLLVCAPFFGQTVELQEQSTVTNEGLYFWYPNDRKAFDYAANISPRGDCFTVANGYIFFGWYKGGMSNRNLMISRKKIGSGNWKTVQLPHNLTLVNERFQPTPYPNGLGNSHQTISIGVSEKDNTIHIFFDHHNDPLNYIVSQAGKAFVPDSEFRANIFERRRTNLAPGENIRITYPELTENDRGDLIVNYRSGTSHGGDEIVHSYDGVWTRARTISKGRGTGIVGGENYAYGTPVFANGQFYYAFSVRWDNNRSALNEGIYLAKCGPNFTGPWVDPNGVRHNLPIKDYSPFLIDDPATENNGGASSSVGIAVSDDGDVHLHYRGRGRDSRFFYSYVRKAGENNFTKHRGEAKTGVAWGNRIYNVTTARNGIITIESTEAGSYNYREELRFNANKTFGNSEYRIVDGKIVVIVEDRSDNATDKQPIYCYVFSIGDDVVNPPNNSAPIVSITSPADGAVYEMGQEITLSANASDPDGNLERVNFFVNDVMERSDAERPFSHLYTPTQPGTYTIRARAVDSENLRTDASVTITVSEANLPPIASFSTPTESILQEGYPELIVTVEASDPNEDAFSVMLKINGQEVRSESVAPYEWGHAGSPNPVETVGLAVGDHVLEAVVTDERGMSTTISKTITVDRVTSTWSLVGSEQISVFPNPSETGVFNLSKQSHFEVYNVTGSSVLTGSGEEVDLSSSPKGLYFLKLEGKIIQISR